jgi:hypothetical protein
VSLTDASGQVQTLPASIIGKDASHDLAVLSIEAPDGIPAPLPLGSSSNLKVSNRQGSFPPFLATSSDLAAASTWNAI